MDNGNARLLPDVYRKDTQANNYKLLEINKAETDALIYQINAVDESADLEKAYGKTLDLFGDMVGQARGSANDIQYRYLIKAKSARNLSQGDYLSVLDAMVIMFLCRYDEVAIIEDEDKPCLVKIVKLPLYVLHNAGFTTKQAFSLILPLLPVGVNLESLIFESTLEFGQEKEYGKNSGFADDMQLIGGYFGALLGEDEEGAIWSL